MSTFDNAARTARSYFQHTPLFTCAVLIITVGIFLIERSTVGTDALLRLDPAKVDLKELHRLNTYPLVHTDILHLIINLIALVPMMGGYEKEKGTLTTALMILGPFSTFPAAMYLAIEIYIFKGTTPVVGSSVWVFLFAAIEAIKAWRISPFYSIAGYRIPTWFTPLGMTLIMSLLIPSCSLLGHLCAIAIGYAYACGYLKIFEPPEKVLAFVESKLKFVLDKVKPYYISLDRRDPGAGLGSVNGPPGGSGGSYLPVSNPPTPLMTEFVGTGPTGRPLGSS